MFPEHIATLPAWVAALGTVLGLVAAVPRARRGLSKLGWQPVVALLAIVILGTVLRWLMPGYQRMYTDEAYYMLAGSNMASGFGWPVDGSGYEKSYGWPALLGIAYLIAPRGVSTALGASGLLGVLTIPLLFTAAILWWGRKATGPALWACFLLSISPLHALWSNTAESNVPGGFALTAILLAVGLWLRTPTVWTSLFVVSASALACSIRPEALVTVAVLAAVQWRQQRRLFWLLMAGVLLAVPNLLVYLKLLLAVHLPGVEQSGRFEAMVDPWRAFVTAPLQPAIALLALVGLVVGWRCARAQVVLLGAWLCGTLAFLSLAGAGAGASERFLAGTQFPALLLAGYALHSGLQRLSGPRRVFASIVALLACAVVAAPGYSRYLDWNPSYQLQHRLPEALEPSVPDGCLLVANLPEMYRATTDLEVVSAKAVLAGEVALADCALFVWDLTCFEWRDPVFAGRCKALAAKSEAIPLAVFPTQARAPKEARLLRLQ